MHEVRRFLRYTLPGLGVVLIGFGSLWLLGLIPAGWMGGENLLAKFAGTFVASGALGYLLANLYFAVRWLPFLENVLIIDHKRVMRDLEDELEISGPSDQLWEPDNLTLFDAWSILTHYCVSQPKTDDHMHAIVEHTKTMVDVTHGLGALCTGVILATLAVLVQVLRSPESLRVWIALVVLLALCVVLWLAFRQSLRALESVSNSAFVTSIRTQFQDNKIAGKHQKVRIYYEKLPTPLEPPGRARALKSQSRGIGLLFLDWKRPRDGGVVAAYRIERRERGTIHWMLISIAIETKTSLENQERGRDWKYRVIAVNKVGTSAPSNTVGAVV